MLRASRMKNLSIRKLYKSVGIISYSAKFILLFLTYFFTAKLSLALGPVHNFAALIWFPAGIALGVILLNGWKLWPAIALAAFLANHLAGAAFISSLGIAFGNTLAPLLSASLLRKVQFHPTLDRFTDPLWLLCIGTGVGPLISATIGVGSLVVFGTLPQHQFYETWLAWLVGDMFSVLLMTPLVLSIGHIKFSTFVPTKNLHELILLYVLAIATCVFVFQVNFSPSPGVYLFPFLIWSAVRFRVCHIVNLLAAISFIAITYTYWGAGPFIMGSLHSSLLQLQGSMAILSVSGISLASTIFELRRSDEDLKRSRDYLAGILQVVPEGIMIWDKNAKLSYINEAGEKMLGERDRHSVIGLSISNIATLFHISDEEGQFLAPTETPAQQAFRTKVPQERLMRVQYNKDSPELWRKVKAVPVLNKKGEVETCITLFQDVTDLKKSEARAGFMVNSISLLSRSLDYQATLQAVVNLAVPQFADCCCIEWLDASGIQSIAIAHSHPELASLAKEYRRRFPINLNDRYGVAKVLHTGSSQLYPDLSSQILAENIVSQEQIDMLKALRFNSVMIVPMIIRGKTVGALMFVAYKERGSYTKEDLEFAENLAHRAGFSIDNARLYNELQNALRLRDEFLSIASHELKTPLTSLILQLQILQRGAKKLFSPLGEVEDKKTAGRKSAADLLFSALKQSQFLAHLIDELLDLTRIRLGRLELNKELMNLTEITKEVANRFQIEYAAKGSEIVVSSNGEITGLWDRYRVEQVISNLISNAIKYGERKPIEVVLDAYDHTAKISILDHGMGIPIELQSKIFERFERAASTEKIGGLGLGLYISRQIVEAHRGRIAVESKVGAGSRFTVELPM